MAQTDFYLKLGTIEGESTAKGVEKYIEIESFTFGVDNAASYDRGGGLASGKAQAHPLNFSKIFDKSTPMIYKACSRGEHIGKAELICRKNTGKADETYLTITLTEVLVTNSSSSGSNGFPIPSDSFSLSFNKIEMEYKEQDAKGALGKPSKMSFDIKKAAVA